MQSIIETKEKKGKNSSSWHIKFLRIKIAALAVVAIASAVLVLGHQGKGIEVSAGVAVKDTIEQTVFGTGKLEVKNKQEFYSKISTVVAEVLTEAGQKVSKGQVILRTDDNSLRIEALKNKLVYTDIQPKLISCRSNIKLY